MKQMAITTLGIMGMQGSGLHLAAIATFVHYTQFCPQASTAAPGP